MKASEIPKKYRRCFQPVWGTTPRKNATRCRNKTAYYCPSWWPGFLCKKHCADFILQYKDTITIEDFFIKEAEEALLEEKRST